MEIATIGKCQPQTGLLTLNFMFLFARTRASYTRCTCHAASARPAAQSLQARWRARDYRRACKLAQKLRRAMICRGGNHESQAYRDAVLRRRLAHLPLRQADH